MSFRLAAVSPTCLSSRLARTCLHLHTLQRYNLVANQSTTAVALDQDATENTPKESAYKRDVGPDGGNLLDGNRTTKRVPTGVSIIETTQPLRPYTTSKQAVIPSAVSSRVTPYESERHFWPQDWNVVWERLHTELLEVRCDQSKNIKDLWHNHHEFAKTFIGQLNASEMEMKWQALTSKEKGKVLPILLAGSLAESAAQTLFVLSNIDIQSTFNFRIRMQCLRHIHLNCYHELTPNSEARRIFEEEMAILRSPKSWPRSDIPIPHLDTLLVCSRPEQCDAIVNAYQKKYPFAQPTSLLPVIMSHIKHGNIEKAFEHFKQLPEQLLQDPTGIAVRSRNCLLKLDTVTKTETGSNFKFLPQVLALGVQPDALLHNAVIEAALANEVPDVAWDLYHHLQSNKHEINARSHLVLLRDAFQRGQIEAVNSVMTAIHENKDLVKDRYLIAYSMNIVRNICFFERKAPPEESLSHILALYDRAYTRAPLYKLRILNENNRMEDNNALPNPHPSSLAFTIWSFVLVQYSTEVVDMLWGFMRQLIAEQDQDVIAVAKLDIVYNGLILFYARKPQSMEKAMQVLQYMLRSNLCVPSERTWSLLLCGFLRYKLFRHAKDVLHIMRVRGVKMEQLSQEHLHPSAFLKAMAVHAGTIMDERAMPTELVDATLEPSSIESPFRMSEGSLKEPSSLELPTVWKGFADMQPSNDVGRFSADTER